MKGLGSVTLPGADHAAAGPAARVPVGPGEVAVVVPSFDEAGTIGDVVDGIEALGLGAEVIVSSDGSTDGTEAAARRHGATVIHHRRNRGKSAALRDGIAAAMRRGCEVVVLMDGDGQHDPADLPALIDPILTGDADIVLGSRYLGSPGRGATPVNRYLVRSSTSWIVGRVLGRPVTDPYCGYRALSRAAADVIALRGSRYQCELEMLFVGSVHELQMTEVPVQRIYGSGTTKMGARYGRLLGRMVVLSQYARAIGSGALVVRKSRAA